MTGILMTRKAWIEMKPGFMKSLGAYRRPERGEMLETGYGKAKVSEIPGYAEIINEMTRSGVPEEEIKRFGMRVENFLGNKEKYFECELLYPDGESERIDWSEYLAIRKRRKG